MKIQKGKIHVTVKPSDIKFGDVFSWKNHEKSEDHLSLCVGIDGSTILGIYLEETCSMYRKDVCHMINTASGPDDIIITLYPNATLVLGEPQL